jgi:acetyl esterase/lipase
MKAPAKPIVFPNKPLFTRFRLQAALWLVKRLMGVFLGLRSLRSRSLPAGKRPTLVKSYPPLPAHEARIFIPKTYKAGDKPLPLLIDIHGGGFCFGAPARDDEDNLLLSQTHGICVVSIPYRLGPEYKYPFPMFDAAAMVSAVLADDTLPVDKTRVVLAGYSAGGNLALSIGQLPLLKGKISGAVAYYPATNNAQSANDRVKSLARRNASEQGAIRLSSALPMLEVGFIPFGTDRRDPLLSPLYAHREDLPPKICIIGCEHDVLVAEVEEMAEDLATSEEGESRHSLGKGKNGWTQGRVRWELIEGASHGFNRNPARGPEGEILREKALRMHEGVVEWLKKEVYSS